MENSVILTDEKFQEIYTNKDFRNSCAGAHKCCDQFFNFKHYETCTYPTRYIISEEQINKAKELKAKQKQEVLDYYNSSNCDNVLVLIAMGCDFDPNSDNIKPSLKNSDICNYRVRGNFKTPKGIFFIEYSTDKYGNLYCDFSLDLKTEQYNYGGIERILTNVYYNKKYILSEINRTFGGKFEKIIIDRYDISTNNFISRSF